MPPGSNGPAMVTRTIVEDFGRLSEKKHKAWAHIIPAEQIAVQCPPIICNKTSSAISQ